MLKRLMINADDFGLCPATNRAIVEAHREGVVTSASLMVNMAGFEHAVELAHAHPALRLGIHLTLAAGRPVSPPGEVASLVDGEGRFLRRRRLLARLLTGAVRRAELERELRAQVSRFRNARLVISRIDGDQHVHLFPQVRDLVIELARELGASVRIPCEKLLWRIPDSEPRPSGSGLAAIPAKLALRYLSASLRRRCRRNGVRTNDEFLSTFGVFPQRPPCPEDLVLLLARLRGGLTELMVHPSFREERVEKFWGREDLASDREREFYSLTSAEFKCALEQSRALVSSYV